MNKSIGKLFLENGEPLLKMWSIDVPPGTRTYRNHSHTKFEITVVNSGSGEYTTENAVYPMLPGDIFVFSSNEIHSITQIHEEGLTITNLHFEPRYLSDTGTTGFNESYINFCFSHSPEFKNRIPSDRAKIIRHNHAMIKEEFLNERKEYPVAIKSYLNLILVDLLRNHNYQAPQQIRTGNICPDILAVYDYIDKHLCEELDLNTLSKIVGLSPNYFSHIFKQLNGITLWDYITAKRIEKATTLICTDSKLTILEIALQSGFNNTVNFNKAFKKQKGFTPSELRKNPHLLTH